MKRKYQDIISDEESSSEDEVTVTKNHDFFCCEKLVDYFINIYLSVLNTQYLHSTLGTYDDMLYPSFRKIHDELRSYLTKY